MQIWKCDKKGNDRIIAYSNGSIYKVNPKPSEIENVVFDLNMNKVPSHHCIEIPHHYLKQVNLEEGRNYIEVLFGNDSTEHLRITDETRRKEVFEYFKMNIPNTIFSIDHFSKIRAGKKTLIAMSVVGILFVGTYYYADGIERGYVYDVEGGHYDSMAGIVLSLASLGTNKVLLIFGSLLMIAALSLIQKIKRPKIISRITVRR